MRITTVCFAMLLAGATGAHAMRTADTPFAIKNELALEAVEANKEALKEKTTPFIEATTMCFAVVVLNARKHNDMRPIDDLVNKKAAACLHEITVMVDAIDQAYGAGTGMDYYVGKYMDYLPGEIQARLPKASAGK